MAVDTATQRPHLLYHLGAYTLDKNFTRITRQCTEALFSGSTNDDLIWWTDCVGTPKSQLNPLAFFLSVESMLKKTIRLS